MKCISFTCTIFIFHSIVCGFFCYFIFFIFKNKNYVLILLICFILSILDVYSVYAYLYLFYIYNVRESRSHYICHYTQVLCPHYTRLFLRYPFDLFSNLVVYIQLNLFVHYHIFQIPKPK